MSPIIGAIPVIRRAPELSIIKYHYSKVRVVETKGSKVYPFPPLIFLLNPHLLLPNEEVNPDDLKSLDLTEWNGPPIAVGSGQIDLLYLLVDRYGEGVIAVESFPLNLLLILDGVNRREESINLGNTIAPALLYPHESDRVQIVSHEEGVEPPSKTKAIEKASKGEKYASKGTKYMVLGDDGVWRHISEAGPRIQMSGETLMNGMRQPVFDESI